MKIQFVNNINVLGGHVILKTGQKSNHEKQKSEISEFTGQHFRLLIAVTLSVALSVPGTSFGMGSKPVEAKTKTTKVKQARFNVLDPSFPTFPSADDPNNPFPTDPTTPTDPNNPFPPADPTDPNNPFPPADPTNPFPPTDPSNPFPPTNPTNPFPGNSNFPGSSFPGGFPGSGSYYCSNYSGGFGGAFGGMNGMSNPPGTPAPRDMNNRPIIYPACNVPAEYDCPLFENRPHEALNLAIDALNQAMTTVPECQEQKATMESVQQNTEAIRLSLVALQGFMQQPDTAYANLPALEQGITAAMQGANNIGQIFTNNSFTKSRCGQELMSTGKVLLGLNDLLNNLAPYALMAVAINPGMGVAAKFAITGGAIATSAISSIVSMVNMNTVDMNNPEHRKAVLKNTCHFTKIARKVRFMQLAQAGQITKISQELGKQIEVKKAALKASETATPALQDAITYTESTERLTGGIESQIKKDNFELASLEAQLAEARNDQLYTCLIAQELVRRSVPRDQNNFANGGFYQTPTTMGVFPMSIAVNLEEALRITNTTPDTKITSLRALNDLSRRRISALEPKVLEDDGGAIKMCADTTRSWVNGLRQLLKSTSEVVNKERSEIEAQLAKNPDYLLWRERYNLVKAEEATANRVTLVMKELAKDNSVIDRSELDQRMMLLKSALFGVSGTWNWGRSPIEEWLLHTMRLQNNRISSFSQNIQQLQVAAAQLLDKGPEANVQYRMILDQREVQSAVSKAKAANLDAINLTTVPLGSRGHQLACQMIETAWLDWTSSFDHLGSTEFMCNMIDAHIDNKIEKTIVKFCRGDVTLDGRQLKDSRILEVKKALVVAPKQGQPSYRDWALLIGKKLQDLQCPTPPLSVMN